MCLILLAWRARPGMALAVAANRDEFHGRQAAPAAFWEDRPQILAGRDLQAMGTWMGVSRDGRFAAVTNYRGAHEPAAKESRGALVTRFLESDRPAAAYVSDLQKKDALYSGFNLLAFDGSELWWHSNRDSGPRRLDPGIYGLGNFLLDSPDVEPSKARFRETLEVAPGVEPLFAVLEPARIVQPLYGTRCSTVLLLDDRRDLAYAERSFAPDGAAGDTLRFRFTAA